MEPEAPGLIRSFWTGFSWPTASQAHLYRVWRPGCEAMILFRMASTSPDMAQTSLNDPLC
jgi:hypothetical protein